MNVKFNDSIMLLVSKQRRSEETKRKILVYTIKIEYRVRISAECRQTILAPLVVWGQTSEL